MPSHSDRRETQQSAKRGPPLPEGQFILSGWLASQPKGGCPWKPLGQRRVAGTGNQPALHDAPCREASSGNHGGSM